MTKVEKKLSKQQMLMPLSQGKTGGRQGIYPRFSSQNPTAIHEFCFLPFPFGKNAFSFRVLLSIIVVIIVVVQLWWSRGHCLLVLVFFQFSPSHQRTLSLCGHECIHTMWLPFLTQIVFFASSYESSKRGTLEGDKLVLIKGNQENCCPLKENVYPRKRSLWKLSYFII